MPHLRRSNEAEQTRRGGRARAFRLLPGIYDAAGGPSLRVLHLRPIPLLLRDERVGSFSCPFLFSKSGGGAKLACSEIFQGAEACVEFGGRQAALAVERTQKIRGCTVALARVAFHTGGNQVAVEIASEARAGHDVVEALHVSGSAAETIKAGAAFAIVNGFAESPGLQEIRGFERRGRRLPGGPRGSGRAIFPRAERADLLGQAHLDEVAGLAAFEPA